MICWQQIKRTPSKEGLKYNLFTSSKSRKESIDYQQKFDKFTRNPDNRAKAYLNIGYMSKKLLIYGDYTKLIDRIRYFDREQTADRLRVSQILLANFIAVGFIFSSHTIISFNRLLLSIGVSSAALLLITVFAILDLIIRERLLIACFAEVYLLENKHEWIPPTHHFMIEGKKHHGSGTRKVIFYLGSSFCLTVVITSCVCYLPQANITITLLTSFIIFISYCLFLNRLVGNFQILFKKAIHNNSGKGTSNG